MLWFTTPFSVRLKRAEAVFFWLGGANFDPMTPVNKKNFCHYVQYLLLSNRSHRKISCIYGEASENLKNALIVDLGTKSAYLQTHMPKTISSYVKIWEVGRKSVGNNS